MSTQGVFPGRSRRPRWWPELLLVAVVYALYSAVRVAVRGDKADAVAHGLAILHVERLLRLDPEALLNHLFTEHAWLGVPADFGYATLHYLVTPAVLVWLFRRRQAHYRRLRAWLMCGTLTGLAGFALLPTCPPRLLEGARGLVDTMAQYGHYGWWGADASAPRGLGGLTNEFAAMPSLHVGWALWCGAVLWLHGPRAPWVRAAAVAYPVTITFVVLGTGNHYLLDALAGCAVMGAGWLLAGPYVRAADRARGWLRAREGAGAGVGATDVSGGCQTSARTAVSREANADDPFPRQRDRDGAEAADGPGAGRPGAGERPAPAAR